MQESSNAMERAAMPWREQGREVEVLVTLGLMPMDGSRHPLLIRAKCDQDICSCPNKNIPSHSFNSCWHYIWCAKCIVFNAIVGVIGHWLLVALCTSLNLLLLSTHPCCYLAGWLGAVFRFCGKSRRFTEINIALQARGRPT